MTLTWRLPIIGKALSTSNEKEIAVWMKFDVPPANLLSNAVRLNYAGSLKRMSTWMLRVNIIRESNTGHSFCSR